MSSHPPQRSAYIEIVSDHGIELRAKLDERDAWPLHFHASSIAQAMRQLELWFGGTADAHYSISVRNSSGESWQLSTPRWHVALYFVLSTLERHVP